MQKGVKLSEITYEQAKDFVNKNSIIMLPIGGASKEHGPHLPCGTDFYVTEYIAEQIVSNFPLLMLPTLPYAYYPAFIDWPGSVTLDVRIFMDIVKNILQPFIKQGVKKFIILDGGVSTHYPLKILSYDLHNEYGITLAVTNIKGLGVEVEKEICQQKRGGHGDESETSCMLHIKPELVHMEKAVEEYSQFVPGAVQNGVLKVSIRGKMTTPNGINGNSKLATAEKGKKILQAMVDDVLEFLRNFKNYKD